MKKPTKSGVINVKGRKSERGIALILTLAILVLVTLLVVAFAVSMRVENTASKNFNDLIKARQLAQGAVDQAVATIRQATTRDGVNIINYVTFPGAIYDYNGIPGSATPKPLYSAAAPGAVASDTFDLNDAIHNTMWITGVGGEFPATTASQFPVGWVYVADDGTVAPPTGLPMTGKPIVGRYVFWVDDEASKINLNTAGTPVPPLLPDYGTSLSNDVDLSTLLPNLNLFVGGIEATQQLTGFTTVQEVKRADPVDSDYTANRFSLTTYSNDANYTNYTDELDAFGVLRRPFFGVNGLTKAIDIDDLPPTNISAVARLSDPATIGKLYGGATFDVKYPVVGVANGLKQVIANIIAYQLDPTSVTRNTMPDDGLSPPTYLGLAKTPYINEVKISYTISADPTTPSAVDVTRIIQVELFYIYDGTYTTGNNETIQLNNLPSDGVIIPTSITISIPAGTVFNSAIPATTYAVFTITPPEAQVILPGPVSVPLPLTGPIQVQYFRKNGPLPAARLDYASMLLTPVTLDPTINATAWHGAQAADPCVNDAPSQWESYANPFVGTLGAANTWQLTNPGQSGGAVPATYPFSVGADVSKAVIRGGPMQSLGELGYIHRPEPWKHLILQPQPVAEKTLNQIPDWAMLDLFTVGNATIPNLTAGRININSFINPSASGPTSQRLVPLKALLNTLGLPATVPSDIYADARAGETYGMASTGAGIFDTIGEICEILTLIPVSATTDNDREAPIRRIANLITTRSSTFTIWVTAQSIKQPNPLTYGRFTPGTDVITGEVRVQAVVERYEVDGVPKFRVRYLRYL